MYYAAEGVVSTDPLPAGIEITTDQYHEAIEGFMTGKTVSIKSGFSVTYPPAPALPEPEPITLKDFQHAIQVFVDDTARSKGFNDGATLASYWNSTEAEWQSQAREFSAWRDAVWKYSYAELARFSAGQREQPTVAEFLLELPKISWAES